MSEHDELVPTGAVPPLTPEEQLTQQFYVWEKRGRGWKVWDYPVELEPPFYPFLFHSIPSWPLVDDARKPTFFSALADRILGKTSEAVVSSDSAAAAEDFREPVPRPVDDGGELVELQVTLPPALKTTKDATAQFLVGLTYSSCPLSFELIGLPESVTVQLACRSEDRDELQQQLQAHFPESVLTERTGFLTSSWDDSASNETLVVDFGLSREFMLPLRTFKGFEVDPLIGAVGALADLREGELGLLQVLFRAARYPWAESIMRAVTDWEGRPFFAEAPELVSLAKQKIAHPLFAAVVRVAGLSPTYGRAWQISKALAGTLTQFANPTVNELIPLTNDGYPETDHQRDLLRRETRRGGMLLNLDELTSLVHLPSASVRSAKLKREEQKTKAAPALVLGHRLVLGENHHAGKRTIVTLSPDQRTRHTYVIGASGTGKSTLLLNLIIQDVRNGEGVAVLDPHGDLIDEVLGYIPEERFADVVLLDPSDEGYPVGFNILSAHSELEKSLLGSDLVAVFRRLSTSWGDQMTSVLGNGILAFLESERGGTLADLRRFLIEADFRQTFLKTVRDPEVVYYWQKEFPLLTGKPQGPILTRLDTFLRPKLIRYMVCQKENRLDFGAIMNQGKIFLAKLAQGTIGEENAYLLGAFLVSKFHQLAMGRQQVGASERRNFYLYIDEFHNFVTPSMAAILSGARKYHLGLILAHQELHQLWNRDSEVASAVISNPYTRVCFRLGDFDAKKLEEGFSFFGAKDLQNLETGEAICRMERSDYDFNLKTLPLPAVEPETARRRRERIVALSRERYAARKEAVEAYLSAAVTPIPPEETLRERPPQREKPDRRATPVTAPSEAMRTKATPAETLPGRGGQQHKYLQQLIKRWAESKGYRATVEKQILEGLGSVDVALEKGGRSIACEISVTSTTEQEVGNIEKCLAAGFESVVLVSSDKKVLANVTKAASVVLNEEQIKRVRFLTPEQLFAFIEAGEVKAARGEEAAQGSKEVLTAKEVEDMLQIDVKTIYSYVQRGLLPYVRIQSNLRFLKSEILKWVEEHRFRPKPPSSRK